MYIPVVPRIAVGKPTRKFVVVILSAYATILFYIHVYLPV